MIENGKISARQLGILIFLFSYGSAGLLVPSIMVLVAKQDTWISSFLGFITIVSFIFLWTKLFLLFPDETIIQYSNRILGKWLGKIVGIFYLLFFLYLGALVLRNLGDFITTNVLLKTPLHYVELIFMFPVLYGTYLGLEVIARSSEILFPWILMLLTITMVLLVKDIDLSRLLPILPDGWQPVLKGAYPVLGFPYSETVVFLMFIPFVIELNQVKKYFYLAYVTSSGLGILLLVVIIAVLGVDITARGTYSVFDLAREINVGNFISRMEVLVGGFWIMTIYIKLVIVFYAANLAAAQIFNLKSYRITILPFGIMVMILSMMAYKNPTENAAFIMGAYPIYSMIHGIVIPALLLIIAKIRKLKQA